MKYEDVESNLVDISEYGRVSGRKVKDHKDLDPKDGISRPTGSEGDKLLRDYVVNLMNEAGLEVKVDKVGNIFGRLEGETDNTIMTGSHIDSVINGGNFDGAG